MKLIKNASGKSIVKLSKTEWESIGLKAGWISRFASDDFPRDPRREFNPNADISNVKAVSSMIRSIILQMNSMVSNYNNKGYFLTDSTKNCRDYLDRIAKEYVMTPFDINYYYRYTEKIDRNINQPDFVLQLVDSMVSGLEYTINELNTFISNKNKRK